MDEDREFPSTTGTAATMPQEQPANTDQADEEGARLSTAPTPSTGDADPTHESGYGFGV